MGIAVGSGDGVSVARGICVETFAARVAVAVRVGVLGGGSTVALGCVAVGGTRVLVAGARVATSTTVMGARVSVRVEVAFNAIVAGIKRRTSLSK